MPFFYKVDLVGEGKRMFFAPRWFLARDLLKVSPLNLNYND